jgi:8-oxo-dGTP pyrophosphatase MutT (NUDIX family)
VSTASASAEQAKTDIRKLTSQTQDAVTQLSGMIGEANGRIAKIEEAQKARPVASAKGGSKEPAVAGPGEYVVKKGDTGASIARANGVSLTDLKTVNPRRGLEQAGRRPEGETAQEVTAAGSQIFRVPPRPRVRRRFFLPADELTSRIRPDALGAAGRTYAGDDARAGPAQRAPAPSAARHRARVRGRARARLGQRRRAHARRQLVLVRQFRFGIHDFSLEVPGGVIESGEDPVAAGVRELAEETGFAGGTARLLGSVHPNPAIQDNRCHAVLVEGVTRSAPLAWDPDEEIEISTAPVDDVLAWARAGRITHSLSLNALMLFEPRWAELRQVQVMAATGRCYRSRTV